MKELLKLDSICQSYAQVKNDPVFWLTVYKCPTVSLRHWSALRVYRVDICPIWVTVPRAPSLVAVATATRLDNCSYARSRRSFELVCDMLPNANNSTMLRSSNYNVTVIPNS